MTAIAILGEYTPASAPQATTTVAIGHAQARLVAPSSPHKDLELTLWAIRRAREARRA